LIFELDDDNIGIYVVLFPPRGSLMDPTQYLSLKPFFKRLTVRFGGRYILKLCLIAYSLIFVNNFISSLINMLKGPVLRVTGPGTKESRIGQDWVQIDVNITLHCYISNLCQLMVNWP